MRKTILTILLSMSFGVSFADNTSKPTVEILATGGTIAGTASSQTSTIYKAGSLTAEQLVASVHGLSDIANIKYTSLQ